MEKFLKKNLKKIIVICLVVLLISNKVHENFTTVQALDAIKSTEAKVNDIFSHVDDSEVKIDKILKLNQHMKITNPAARIYFNDDNNNRLFYNATNDGPELKGRKLIKLAAPDGVWSTGPLKAGSLCIGDTCLNEDHLKMITDGFKLKITDNGSSSTQGLNKYIHNHGGTRLGPHNRHPTKLKMYKY